MTAPRLSIVVPTHQRRESVLRLLRALRGQTASPELFEVIVAVDGSEDGTREAVGAHTTRFSLRQAWQPQSGRAAACNAGARLAKGEVLLFIDDDMEPCERFVKAHLASHETGPALGVVGAAPIVVGPNPSPIVSYRAAGFARKMERLSIQRDNLRFSDVYTGNFSVRRHLFVAAGGYDEEFRLYGHEDYELSLRLGHAGVRFIFNPAAIARQHYAKTFGALAADIEAEGSTAVLFARKHPEVLASLPLGRYASRSCRTRTRLSTVVLLSRVYPGLASHMSSVVEHTERRTVPPKHQALFARYDRTFELLYWMGAERALHGCGAPWYHVAIQDVERWISWASASRSASAR